MDRPRLELFPGKHLFVDDLWLEQLQGVSRVLNQPVQVGDGPVLCPEQPWEVRGVSLGSVLFDEQRRVFRLWYAAKDQRLIATRVVSADNPPVPVYGSHLCYAESDDGWHWRRLPLGQIAFEGDTDTNIYGVDGRDNVGGSGVIKDPFEADGAQTFKMMFLEAQGSARAVSYACSADGTTWRRAAVAGSPAERLFGVMAYADRRPTGAMNPDARFVLYGQRGSPWATRQIGRRESDDYFHWSDNRPVIESRVDDPPGLEFYGLKRTHGNERLAAAGLRVPVTSSACAARARAALPEARCCQTGS